MAEITIASIAKKIIRVGDKVGLYPSCCCEEPPTETTFTETTFTETTFPETTFTETTFTETTFTETTFTETAFTENTTTAIAQDPPPTVPPY